MDEQQKPIVEYVELFSMLCSSLNGRGIWGRMDTCIGMAESIHCSPETITTLLIGCTPIQNVLVLNKKKIFKVKKMNFFQIYFLFLFLQCFPTEVCVTMKCTHNIVTDHLWQLKCD